MRPPLRVAFAPGAPLAARVEGARSGRPLAGAGVIVVARTAEGASLTLQSGTADPSGSLRLASFPPLGAGGFAVLAAGIGGDWREADGSQDVRVQVRLGATLSGHVRTADGRPVAGARVVAHAWDWPALETTTDEAGAYEIRGLPRTRPYSRRRPTRPTATASPSSTSGASRPTSARDSSPTVRRPSG